MSHKLLLIAALAALALAQPLVNAPLLPVFTDIETANDAATTGAVTLGGWAFTGGSQGVYALNISAPQGTNSSQFFFPTRYAVSQIFAFGNYSNISSMGVIAISKNLLTLYQFNSTMVWRQAWFWAQNASFDIQADSSVTPSYMYPAFAANPSGSGWMFVLGTKNTSSLPNNPRLPSTIYAFDPMTLVPVWQTTIMTDTTNFAPTVDQNGIVWILGENTTSGTTSAVLMQFYANNGTQLNWMYDTGFYYLVDFQVMYDTFFVIAEGGYYTLNALNGTQLAYESIPSCGTLPYRPYLMNGTWYYICGSYIYMVNNATAQRTRFITNNNEYITCGAGNQMTGDVVFVAEDEVYVINASGINLWMTLPGDRNGYTSYTCTGADFDYGAMIRRAWNSTMPDFDVLHLSFTSSYSGLALSVGYPNGMFLVQAATLLDPVGPAVVDYWNNKVVLASSYNYGSSAEPILIAFDLVGANPNATSFVQAFSNSGWDLTFPIAYNATNRSAYYISSSYVYTIDNMGETAQVASINLYQLDQQPLIIGQYLVIIDVYYNYLYVYDSVKMAIQQVSICDATRSAAPLVNGYQVLVWCSSGASEAANLVDVSASTLKVDDSFTPKNAIWSTPGLGGCLLDSNDVVIATTSQEVRGFNIKGSPATAATVDWTQTSSTTMGSLLTVTSAPACFQGSAYIVGTILSLVGGGQERVIKFGGTFGTMSAMTVLTTNWDAPYKTISIMSGGIFGGGIMYIIGWANITAFDINMNMMFNYQHKNGSIQTRQQGNPVVLPASGAICFYDFNDNFNVVGGFKGGLAWSYPTNIAAGATYSSVQTDNMSVFFLDGTYVVGADIWSGAVNTQATYLTSDVQGFAVAPGPWNTTSIVASTENQVVFSMTVNQVPNPNPYFPGAGSAPGGNGGSGFGGSSSKTGLIAGVIVGVIVVLAIIVVIAKRGGGGGRADDNYVPMNPSTQV